MSAAKTFFIGSVLLFGTIGVASWIKKGKETKKIEHQLIEIPISLSKPVEVTVPPPAPIVKPAVTPVATKTFEVIPLEGFPSSREDFPEVDRIAALFALDASKLPIVETVSFTSRVPWLKGRPAWISDYASFYETSRHFIARSLNKKADYFSQKVSPGARFNVFRKDKDVSFHLLIDLSRCRMLFYYIDKGANERVLLKTYKVGLGRPDSSSASGYATPIGTYSIGNKVAIYKPGTMGYFQEEKTEMVRVFGTRWIPFEKELEGCTRKPKGLGIHGVPWVSGGMSDGAEPQLHEDKDKIGKYESNGSICLASADMEELFAIIVSKPTTVELVKELPLEKLRV